MGGGVGEGGSGDPPADQITFRFPEIFGVPAETLRMKIIGPQKLITGLYSFLIWTSLDGDTPYNSIPTLTVLNQEFGRLIIAPLFEQ